MRDLRQGGESLSSHSRRETDWGRPSMGATVRYVTTPPRLAGADRDIEAILIIFLPTSRDTQGILFHDKSTARGPADVLPENAIVSKRRPSTLMGLGLIEAIPEEALLAHADPDDKDHDGIRGRPAMQDGESNAVWIASASSFALRVCGRCPAPRDGDDVAGAGIYCRNNQR